MGDDEGRCKRLRVDKPISPIRSWAVVMAFSFLGAFDVLCNFSGCLKGKILSALAPTTLPIHYGIPLSTVSIF